MGSPSFWMDMSIRLSSTGPAEAIYTPRSPRCIYSSFSLLPPSIPRNPLVDTQIPSTIILFNTTYTPFTMHFKTTLLVVLSALAAAQQSSNAVENPATGYLAQTNSDGVVTGQPDPATSQQAAATSQPSVVTSQQPAATNSAGTSSPLIPSQTSGGSTLVTSASGQPSSSAGASSTATLTSTATQSAKTTSSSLDDDSSSSSSSSSSAASSSASEGAAAVPTAGSVGLTVGLAGAALAALL